MDCTGGDTTQIQVKDMASIHGKWTHFEVCYGVGSGASTCWVDGGVQKKQAGTLNATTSNHELTFLGSLTGYGDELRIRNGTVSEAWAVADYQNQATDTFLSYDKVKSHNGLILLFK